MIITCKHCSTRYNINEKAINKKEFTARCGKCKNVFVVRKEVSTTRSTVKTGMQKPVVIEGLEKVAPSGKARIISICNQKGGVAKTTSSLNLGISLTLLNKRVLLIDFDIQANLTLLMGHKDARSFFDVIHSNDASLSSYIVKTKSNLWLLPSNSKMALLTKQHLQDENFEYLLREKLEAVSPYFDYIIIDTPPSGDFYTLNSLLASDIAIIPTPCEYLAMQGVNHIVNMINVVTEKSDHTIKYKIPITLFDSSNTASRVVLEKMKAEYNSHMFSTIIEKDDKVQESQIVHTPTIFYDKESRAGRQYFNLAKEVLTL